MDNGPHYLSVSDAARLFRVAPKLISGLLYKRVLRDDLCPVVAGRRIIPHSYLPVVRKAVESELERLREAGVAIDFGPVPVTFDAACDE